MFAYQPQISRAGELLGAGIMKGAEYRADAAAIRGQAMSQLGQDIGGAIQSLAGSAVGAYAENKALDAKDKAYTSFFSKHGKDLGFDPNYLDELKAMSRADRLSAFDLMTSQPGQRLGSLQYMNQQANLFGGNRGAGGGGGGGGGQQPFYVVQ